jgi:hypothetical protein
MVLHSRDPALLFPDEKHGKQEEVNPCEHVLPGSHDCQGQVDKNKCVFQQHPEGECAGRKHASDEDIKKGKRFVAIKRLEDYRSTQQGLGHLSDMRAVHSSPVPFR